MAELTIDDAPVKVEALKTGLFQDADRYYTDIAVFS